MTRVGWYKTVRQVLGHDQFYYLVTEEVECSNKECKAKYQCWSEEIMKQVPKSIVDNLGVTLTYKYAIDTSVLQQLSARTAGNSATSTIKGILQQHSTAHFNKVNSYLEDHVAFLKATKRGLVASPASNMIPTFHALPCVKWLLHTYACYVFKRSDEMKAALTSVFGEVLKIDSTKKVSERSVVKVFKACQSLIVIA